MATKWEEFKKSRQNKTTTTDNGNISKRSTSWEEHKKSKGWEDPSSNIAEEPKKQKAGIYPQSQEEFMSTLPKATQPQKPKPISPTTITGSIPKTTTPKVDFSVNDIANEMFPITDEIKRSREKDFAELDARNKAIEAKNKATREEAKQKALNKNPIVRGLESGFNKVPEAMRGLVNLWKGDKDYWKQPEHIKGFNEGVAEAKKGKSFIGNLPENISEGISGMAPAIMTGGFGATPALIATGVQAGGLSAQEALDEGADSDQAFWYGSTVGTAEGLLEKYLGFIPAFKKIAGEGVGAVTGNARKNALNYTKNYGKKMLGEGVEESVMEPIQQSAKAMLYNDNINKNPFTKEFYGKDGLLPLQQMLESGVIGAGVGGVMGGMNLSSDIDYIKSTQQEIKDNIIPMVNAGLELDPNTKSFQIANQFLNNPSHIDADTYNVFKEQILQDYVAKAQLDYKQMMIDNQVNQIAGRNPITLRSTATHQQNQREEFQKAQDYQSAIENKIIQLEETKKQYEGRKLNHNEIKEFKQLRKDLEMSYQEYYNTPNIIEEINKKHSNIQPKKYTKVDVEQRRNIQKIESSKTNILNKISKVENEMQKFDTTKKLKHNEIKQFVGLRKDLEILRKQYHEVDMQHKALTQKPIPQENTAKQPYKLRSNAGNPQQTYKYKQDMPINQFNTSQGEFIPPQQAMTPNVSNIEPNPREELRNKLRGTFQVKNPDNLNFQRKLWNEERQLDSVDNEGEPDDVPDTNVVNKVEPQKEPLNIAKDTNVPTKTEIKPSRQSNNLLEKWAKNEYVNADLNDGSQYSEDFKEFFNRYYRAGYEGKRTIDVKTLDLENYFPPFLEDIFFKAGKSDAEKQSVKTEKNTKTEVKTEEHTKELTETVNQNDTKTEPKDNTQINKALMEIANWGLRDDVYIPYDRIKNKISRSLLFELVDKKYVKLKDEKQYNEMKLVVALTVNGRKAFEDEFFKMYSTPKVATYRSTEREVLGELSVFGDDKVVYKLKPLNKYDADIYVQDIVFDDKQNKPEEPKTTSSTSSGRGLGLTEEDIDALINGRNEKPNDKRDLTTPSNDGITQLYARRMEVENSDENTDADTTDNFADEAFSEIVNRISEGEVTAEEMAKKMVNSAESYDEILDAIETELMLKKSQEQLKAEPKEESKPDKLDVLIDKVTDLVDAIKDKESGKNDKLDEEVRGSDEGGKTKPSQETSEVGGTEGVSGTKGGKRNKSDGSNVGNTKGESTTRPQGNELGSESISDNGDSEGVRNERINDISRPITQNYRIQPDDVLAEGGKKTRFKNNIKAIKLVKKLEEEGRTATPEEQKVLIKFVGWGGIKEAFAEVWDRETQSYKPEKPDWANEYNELKQLLTPEEYKNARKSILNAHFTSPELISAMYDIARHLGFKGGRILEPSVGIGNFIGMLPSDMYGKSSFLAIELDKITGMIAKHLYPDAKVMISGFQDVNIPDNFIDMAISNVPFADINVSDDTHSYDIHNYFFAKTIDKVKEGGLVIYISATGTMDTSEDKFKKYIDNKADLIGAFRLPNNTFKKNAGTEVTTDIVILRKRSLGEVRKGHKWFNRAETKVKISDNKFGTVNEYFINNPENVLGDYAVDKLYGTRVGVEANGDTMQQLQDRIKTLPENIFSANGSNIKDLTEVEQAQNTRNGRKNNSYIKKGNKLYKVVDGKEVEVDIGEIKDGKNSNENKLAKINALIELKESAMELLSVQKTTADADISEQQGKLNKLYDGFVKKYGYVANSVKLIKDDPDSYILNNLEMVVKNEDGDESLDKKYEKADIFKSRVSSPYTRATKASNAQEALAIVLYEDGVVDVDRIAKLLDTTNEKAIEKLGNLVFENPNGGWETSGEYLSGNVRDKLAKAREASNADPKYIKNVEALEKSLPEPKPFNEIKVTLGATWIPSKVFDDFFREVFKTRVSVRFEPLRGKWEVSSRGSMYSQEIRIFTDGTGKDAGWLLSKILNNDNLEIKYKNQVNVEATMKAKAKAREIERKFIEYVNENAGVQNVLSEHFNALLNCVVERKYSKEKRKYIGMSDVIELRPHQIEAVERIVYGGNTLLAHDVGFGKTFIMISGAMELKRLGIAKKPMMVVPKNKLSDFKNDFAKTYPNAKVLIADAEDFSTHNVKNLFSKIAMNNWDCVIISQSSLPLIPIGNDVIGQHINEQLEEARLVLTLAKQSGEKDYSTGDIEKHIYNLEERLQKLHEMPRYDGVTFEQMGIDYMFVDEAHEYKNLAFPTTKTRIKGINNGGGVTTEDFYIKTKYVTSLHGGKKGLVFATGTPVSNALNELYTMFKYLRPDILRNIGASSFDSWISMFGSIESRPEVGTGGTFKMTERFSGFHNLQELFRLFKEFADMKYDANGLGLNLPKLENGKPEIVEIEVSQEYKDYINDVILERIAKVKPGRAEKGDDGHLAIATDAAKATLDMRMVDSNAKDDKSSKLNRAVDNIHKLYKESSKQKGTQLVFIDKGESKPTGFSAHTEVRNKLIKLGIPANEIALASKYNTDAQKEKLFSDVNAGRIRVLIGTYDKMSTGINVQERLFAIHEVNTPWRPSDILQGEGRMVRQGNLYSKWDIPVKILRYVVTDVSSYDAVKWQTIETKLKSITRLMKGELSEIEAEEDENSSAVKDVMIIKAKALGDERLIRQIELNKELPLLEADRDSYVRKIAMVKDSLILMPDKIKITKESLKKAEDDYEKAKSYGSDINVVVGGETFIIKKDEKFEKDVETPKAKAGKAIRKALEKAYFTGTNNLVTINGIKFISNQGEVYIHSNYTSKRIDDLKTDSGVVDRLSGELLENIASRIDFRKKTIKQIEKDLENAKKEDTSKPFEKEAEYQAMRDEKTTIDFEIEANVPLSNSRTKYRKETSSLNEVEEQLAEQVDQNTSTLSEEARKQRILPQGISVKMGNPSSTAIEDEESEARWQDAKNTRTPLLRSIIEKLTTIKEEFRKSTMNGTFRELDRGSRYAQLRFDLLNFKKAKDKALLRTLKNLQGIVVKMKSKDYDLFNRYVVYKDLMEDVIEGRALPFGFTAESLEKEIDKLDTLLENNSVVQEALDNRKKLWDAIKTEYKKTMKDIGFNADDKFTKENYFRHIVIEYMQKERMFTGTGKKFKTPRGADYLKQRQGSELDIVNDYLQAESEVMAKFLYDIDKAKLINKVDKSQHNILKSLKVKARKMNIDAMEDLYNFEAQGEIDDKGKRNSETEKIMRKFNSKIAYAFSRLEKMGITEREGDNIDEENSITYKELAKLAKHDSEAYLKKLKEKLPELEAETKAEEMHDAMISARTILKYTGKKKALIKEALGRKFVTWDKIIPEGYDKIPTDRKIFYMAQTLPEDLADKILNGLMDSVSVNKEQLKATLVEGKFYKEMVLPVEVLKTLDDLSKDDTQFWGATISKATLRKWKQWQLLSPRRAIKYNLRNITGDADKAFLGSPKVFAKMPQATKELFNLMYNNKPMGEKMKSWFEMGGLQSFLQVQEMGDVNQLKMFLNTVEKKGHDFNFIKGYWKNIRLATDFREAILRYAAYLHYLDDIKNNGGNPTFYGGSLKTEIDALETDEAKAYQLSNELLGAYDDISELGNELRKHLIPFYSFMEANARTYIRAVRNIASDTNSMGKLGRVMAIGGKKITIGTAVRVGRLALYTYALSALLEAFNQFFFHDEEEELPEDVKNRPHIILGRNDDGTVRYFSRLGSLSDFTEWMGLGQPTSDIKDILNGKKTLSEQIGEMVKSPINKAYSSLSPFFKVPAELISGKSAYPDVFNQRTIRDKKEYLAQSIGLENEYKSIFGKPDKGYKNSLQGLLYYTYDPKEQAYYQTMDLKREFEKDVLKKNGSSGFMPDAKSNALYYYKLSLRYKDKESADKYLEEYLSLGGSKKGYIQSIQAMSPMYGLGDKQDEFINSLSVRDGERYELAMKYYEEMQDESSFVNGEYTKNYIQYGENRSFVDKTYKAMKEGTEKPTADVIVANNVINKVDSLMLKVNKAQKKLDEDGEKYKKVDEAKAKLYQKTNDRLREILKNRKK